eukprot:TRINITY_DN34084_c0_g1_i2.p1 TRINITY_DN34084_c0_g1~~TRINITY_DN34084_c0_g1_i2.p1  ORF type:complete len:134 (-),score=37.24 TRINITY_DN34084_c0_g1_i2:79-480(-)
MSNQVPAQETEEQQAQNQDEKQQQVIVIKLNSQNEEEIHNNTQKKKRELTQQSILQSAEYQRLKEQLKEKLVTCGWQDLVKEKCKEKLRENNKKFLERTELVSLVEKQAQAAVPNEVKAYLLQEIKEFLNSVG